MNENNETDDGAAAMVWNETMAYMTALNLIDELYDDAGNKYGDAVRRCIQGLDCRETNLEKEDFKKEVHEKIMGPLKENLETFCAGDLPESI